MLKYFISLFLFYISTQFSFSQERIKRGFYFDYSTSIDNQSMLSAYDGSRYLGELYTVYPNLDAKYLFFGSELGNQWYLKRFDNNTGLALNLSWFRANYGIQLNKPEKPAYATSYSFSGSSIKMEFLRIGPQYSILLSDDWAVDFNYQISPTVLFSESNCQIKYPTIDLVESQVYSVFGFQNSFQSRFRYKKLLLGLEYSFGRLSGSQDYTLNKNNTYQVIYNNGSINIVSKNTSVAFKLGFQF